MLIEREQLAACLRQLAAQGVAAAKLVQRAVKSNGRTKLMLFAGNRPEGHSPGTIRAIVDSLEGQPQ